MNQPIFRFAAIARIIGLTLILVFVISNGAALAARGDDQIKIEMQSVASVSDGKNGALIEWQTAFEIGNLGYNVYRWETGGKVQINPSLIPGSVFIAGQNQPLSGKKYSFFDKKGSLGSVYEIEAVTLDNERQSITVATNYDAKTLSQRGGRETEENSADFLAAKAGQKLLGQRATPATIKIKGGGVLSAEPRIQADAERQRWVAAQPGLKFAIKTNGLYRVTRQQLADAGFDVSVPTLNWQLYTDGVEQNLLFTGDNNGGVLDANGYLEFYGFGVDKLYTDTQTFYLVVGTTPGKRMPNSFGRRISRIVTPSFQTVAQCRTSVAAQCNRPTTYTSNIRNGEAENFFGDVILNAPLDVTINTPFVDSSAAQQAVIDVSIQGFSFNPPTHNFEVLLNGTLIGTISGSGQNVMRASFLVPAGLLQDGANVVRLNSTVFNSVTLLEYVRVHYSRRYVAVNDKLLFTTAYYRATQVDGFTDASIRVFDVSDQNNVKIVNSIVTGNGSGFTVSVLPTLQRLMYAVTDAAVLTPAAITANVPSDVYDTTANKDLLIVTYQDWQTQANALAAYRQSQGLSVAVVNVEDVFDELSFGAPTPAALRDYFAHSLPRYALLFGDATQDPRNYQSSTVNYIPTTLIDSSYGEIASDEVMGDFTVAPGNQPCAVSSGDCVADFPIGRLSVRSAAQAQTQVDKIISFEQTVAAGETFSRGVFFVNDYVNGYNFAATNQALANRLPPNTPVQVTGAFSNPSSAQLAQTRDEIVSRINQGPFIVGYAGHGSNTGWSFPDIFPTANAASLTNSNRLSIFLMLTCLNGAFADFQRDPSLAENLMRNPNGGAAAVWASSGLTVAPGQDIMANHFYDLHRQANVGVRIGDLTREAKLETTDNDVRTSWVLFGDPTLIIK